MQFERSNTIILNGLRRQKLQESLRIICAYLFIPFIFITLNFLYIYRCLVEIVLRIQFKNKFAGLLKGTDYIWAIEDTSLSVINILMILEKVKQNSETIFLEDFKNLMNDRIVSKAAGTTLEKLFYRRRQKFGYYFWERNEEIDLKNSIRWLECENADCDGSCEDISSESFRKNLGSICNKSLPDDHTAAWEILIGKRCPRFRSRVKEGHLSPEKCFNTNACKIPMIFRVHHSLGDGVTLLKLWCEAMVDEMEDEMKIKVENTISINPNKKTIDSIKQQPKISINHLWLNFKDIFLKQVYEKIEKIMRLMMIILSVPKCFIEQSARSTDENSLHGPPQTGEKIVSYWLEDGVDASQKFLMKVRQIRKSTGARFADVVLAAFSASIHKYHLRINKPVPDSLTAILPLRMAMPENMTLDNNFSVAVLRICISNANGQKFSEPNQNSQFFKRLQDITKENNKLRKSSDLLINFWIMKYLFAIIPVKILKLFLLSHSTMAFSNMCGPQRVHILNNSLSNIAFWVPNRDRTALGLSLLTYGGNLHLSLIADKSIISDESSFTKILEDTVYEIDHAYNSIILTRF